MSKLEQMFNRTGVKKEEAHPKWENRWIHYTKLVDNTAQYREGYEKDVYTDEIKAFADLLEADGEVLQNLLVRKIDADKYEIIAGHKRRLACKYKVEVEGKKQYEFLPCKVQHLSDVRARFQVYSSNGYDKTEYEKMHELEEMKYLLETYPEEFPQLQTGRMVERLAKQKNMSRSTVGDYLTISKNLSEKGRKEFASGTLKKSAALEICALPDDEQEKLLDRGVTSQKDIKAYKQQKELPEDIPETAIDIGVEDEVKESDFAPAETEAQKQKIRQTTSDSKPLQLEKTDIWSVRQEEYTTEHVYKEEYLRLEGMLQAEHTDKPTQKRLLKRQKIIVRALELMLEAQGDTGEKKDV